MNRQIKEALISKVLHLRSRWSLLAGKLLSSTIVMLGVATADATTTLRSGPAPLPSYALAAGTSGLTKVSFAAPGNCAAVGNLANGSGVLLLAAGTTWTATTPVPPSGDSRIFLISLSCPTVNGCTVAGNYMAAPASPSKATLAVTLQVAAQGAPAISKVVDELAGFQIKFTAPAYDGGALVTTYQVSVNGGKTWATRKSGMTASPIVVGNLQHHVAYKIEIRAVNAIGHGAASGLVTSTTK